MTRDERTAAPPHARPHATAELSLLVDVGSAWTKVSAVGRSRGRWRIISHAAQPSGWDEAALIGALADRIGEFADQRLRDALPRIIAEAPRISCHTPARAGRLAIASVTEEVSGAAARRAAESAGWVVVEAVAADDGRGLPERLTSLGLADVDAWLVVGGFDSARPELALETAALVAAARSDGSAPVIWAGSASLAADVEALFEPGAVAAVTNPRPDPASEQLAPLRHHLEELLDRMAESGGTRNLAPIGFRRAIAEIAREEHLRVAGVDLGARYATWVSADGTSEPVEVTSRVFASGGLGAPWLGTGGTSRISRSMAMPVDELAIADTLQNQRARPGTLPFGDEELSVTQAAARLLLAALGEDRGPLPADLLVGAGRTLAAAPSPMQAMRLLLDGLRPPGVTQLAIDAAGALPPLGALPDREIGEGIGVLRDDLLVPLGTAVVTRGGRAGALAMRVVVHRTGWPDPEPLEIRTGQLVVIPLARGERAELTIDLEPGVTLAAARRAHRAVVEASGGLVGLVLDARDAPFQLPRRIDDRRAVLAGWREQLLREPRRGQAAAPLAAAPDRRGARDRLFRLGRLRAPGVAQGSSGPGDGNEAGDEGDGA